MTESTRPNSTEQLQSEIEHTSEDLAKTVDELTEKLDVKADAKHRIHAVKSTISDKASQAKQSAPEPVQHALNQASSAAAPAIEKARQYRKQILIGVAVLLLLLIARRRRSS
jgi:hypothetical protein